MCIAWKHPRQRTAFREARIGKLAQETVDEMNFDWWYHKCIKDKRVVGPWCQKARDARRCFFRPVEIVISDEEDCEPELVRLVVTVGD